jgi:hypothetical protein
VEKVNSEKDVLQLLDRNGQLELRNRLNIFIGGQILDRGLTIGNLIGFYYGRRAQRSQQDTVLQHHRMYGSRPAEDLAVTRFYTSQPIYEILRRIHEFDTALRQAFEAGGQNSGVIFIQRDAENRIVPCSPNKILLTSLTTLQPRKRLLPIGFQTNYKSNIQKIVQELNRKIAGFWEGLQPNVPIRIDLSEAIAIVRLIAATFVPAPDTGYEWDVEAFISAMEYVSLAVATGEDEGKVVLLSRRDRNVRRIRESGGFENSPDGGNMRQEHARIAATTVTLMLFGQQGEKELGWLGSPFWWPVLYMPNQMTTVVYAGKVDDSDEDDPTAVEG